MSSSAAVAPVLLALDTATDRIHAALCVGETVYAVALPGGAQASASLLPALGALLTQAGRTWPDVDAIAFGRGPGAFTGLRTACSVTQGLALALGKPVIALDTLMAVAEHARQAAPQVWQAGDVVWVLQDARMDELYVAAFRWDGQDWQPEQAAQLWPLDEPLRRWAPDGRVASQPVRWVGNAVRAYPQRLAALAVVASTEAESPSLPGAHALAQLARRAWHRGDTVDAALALPLYVRDKVAQTTAERQAAKGAGAA